MPVQRIPRHILLLTDLAKHTPPDHPDYAALSKAVERAKEVADVINDAKGRAESNTKVIFRYIVAHMTLAHVSHHSRTSLSRDFEI